MTKKHKLQSVKSRQAYTFKEISSLLDVHVRTVQVWKSEGLQLLNDSKPFLVMGFELKKFLSQKAKSKKIKLEENQFYCTKCRKAVFSLENRINLKISDEAIGKNGFKFLNIQGVCEICNSKLNRFSHTGKLEEIRKNFNVKGEDENE